MAAPRTITQGSSVETRRSRCLGGDFARGLCERVDLSMGGLVLSGVEPVMPPGHHRSIAPGQQGADRHLAGSHSLFSSSQRLLHQAFQDFLRQLHGSRRGGFLQRFIKVGKADLPDPETALRTAGERLAGEYDRRAGNPRGRQLPPLWPIPRREGCCRPTAHWAGVIFSFFTAAATMSGSGFCRSASSAVVSSFTCWVQLMPEAAITVSSCFCLPLVASTVLIPRRAIQPAILIAPGMVFTPLLAIWANFWGSEVCALHRRAFRRPPCRAGAGWPPCHRPCRFPRT